MGEAHRWVMQSTVAACVLVTVLSIPPAVTSATSPGSPGVPQAPTRVFLEDFEKNPTNAAVVLTGYAGGAYTAAAGWLTDCNGWVVMADSPDPGIAVTHCYSEPPQVGNAFSQVPPYAGALGQFAGASDPAAPVLQGCD